MICFVSFLKNPPTEAFLLEPLGSHREQQQPEQQPKSPPQGEQGAEALAQCWHRHHRIHQHSSLQEKESKCSNHRRQSRAEPGPLCNLWPNVVRDSQTAQLWRCQREVVSLDNIPAGVVDKLPIGQLFVPQLQLHAVKTGGGHQQVSAAPQPQLQIQRRRCHAWKVLHGVAVWFEERWIHTAS